MHVVHKVTLFAEETQSISVPKGTLLLTAQYQTTDGQLQLWYLRPADPVHELVTRKILVTGTGIPIQYSSSQLSYIATVQQNYFVWHVFEIL